MDLCLKINIFGEIDHVMAYKEHYEAPAMELIGVEQGYVVCTSGGTEPFTEGGNYGDNLFN